MITPVAVETVIRFAICRLVEAPSAIEAILRSEGHGAKQLKTAPLSAVQPPSDHIQGLLKSLVKSLEVLPDETNPVQAPDELPPALQKVVTAAAGLGHRWAAWRDAGPHVWLYVGQLSRLLSHRKGSPVLQVKHYRETGLVDTCNWIVDRHAQWRRWEE